MMQTFSLTKAQSLAYDFAQGAFSRGLSANKALISWGELGGAIRRTDFLELYRYVGGITEAGYKVQSVRHGYFPDYAGLPDSMTFTRKKYSFDVRVGLTGEVDEHGELIGSYVTVATDEKLRIQGVLDSALDFIDLELEQYEEIIYTEPVVVRARKRGVP